MTEGHQPEGDAAARDRPETPSPPRLPPHSRRRRRRVLPTPNTGSDGGGGGFSSGSNHLLGSSTLEEDTHSPAEEGTPSSVASNSSDDRDSLITEELSFQLKPLDTEIRRFLHRLDVNLKDNGGVEIRDRVRIKDKGDDEEVEEVNLGETIHIDANSRSESPLPPLQYQQNFNYEGCQIHDKIFLNENYIDCNLTDPNVQYQESVHGSDFNENIVMRMTRWEIQTRKQS